MADEKILKVLRAACPAARPAGDGDAVAGVVPRFAATPASLEEASALMRAASQHDLAVVPRGSGSKLAWGAPPRRCDLVVDTAGLNRVLEHAAGDLVARAQAGVSLGQLAEVLAAAGQQLSLDPPPGLPSPDPATGAGRAGTLGGVLATGVAGPRRLRYGAPRDLVIGITIVRADGTVARSGGKVVKNVAGYDLGKLFVGSYGTLGLITEAVVRLHPRPAACAYTLVDCADADAARRAVAAAAGSELAPCAVEVDRPAAKRPLHVGVLLEGDPDGVAERSRLMAGLLGPSARTSPTPPPWWGGPAVPPPTTAGEPARPAGALIRFSFWAAAMPRVFAVIDAEAAVAGLDPAVGGSPAAGVLYAAFGADADPAAVAAFTSGVRDAFAQGRGDAQPGVVADGPPALASAVVVHAPPAVRSALDMWGPTPGLALMRAVKDRFDPAQLMAPGRFAGGI